MKQKISYSTWNNAVDVITVIVWIVFIVMFILFLCFWDKSYDRVWFWLSLGFFIFGWCWTLFCIPVSVSADDDYVRVHKRFNSKKFRISDIESIDRFEKNQNNGGGYARYTNPKNPVLITMKDGRQYVVGTSDPQAFIDYVNDRRR